MPPLPGSPVIDAGSDSATNAPYSFATDQRGLPRVSGTHADIGAVELLLVTSVGDSGPGSLRAAAAAAAVVGGATITFVHNLSGQTILLTSGEILLTNSLAIDASALPVGITINGGNALRAFNVGSGANVTLKGLLITQCSTPDAGGSIYTAAGSSLHVIQCTFTANSGLEGGAMLNDGTLLMENCTFTANNGGYGGALQSRNVTVLNNCTIVGNDAPYGGGGVFNKGSTLTLNNCIVAQNTGGSDLYNQLASVVYNNANLIQNIVYDRSTGTNGPTPLNSAPLLFTLGNYGGSTPTMPPLPVSPVIDAGGTTALATDQRGFPRAVGPAPDLGAVEFGISNAVVTSTADNGIGSLRYAVVHGLSGETVTFDPSLSGQTITLTTGQIRLTNSVTIDASALLGGLFISGNNASRFLAIYNNPIVILNSLSVINCYSYQTQGGAIYSAGVLQIVNCTFSGDQVGGASSYGGAIYNDGTLRLTSCTLSSNGVNTDGGAIFNQGTLTMLACTVSSNSAGAGSSHGGGAIYNNGSVNATNCILAGNSPDNVRGGSFNGASNLTGGNPLLSPLGNYGGPTQTMPPLPGSPAIDAGAATSLTTDQRGFPRLLGAAPDLGAVEGIFNSAGPGTLTGVKRLANGTLQFGFTNYSDSSFSILAATNVALPLNAWSNLGLALETPPGSGHFKFTDPQATNNPQRFYRVKSP